MRLTLFIPGTAPDEGAWTAALRQRGFVVKGQNLQRDGLPFEVQLEYVSNDGEFGRAFALPTVSPELRKAIDAAPGAFVLTMSAALNTHPKAIAELVDAVGATGGLAVRIEESKLGYPLTRWVELVRTADPVELYRTAVLMRVDRQRGLLTSCGMHVFSLPDAEIELEHQRLVDVFNVFQLAEDPVLRSGDTFAPDAQTPRRRIDRWPDGNYPADHPSHNPFGVWRFGPENGQASQKGELEFVFMPALVTLLIAAERTRGTELTRAEVCAIAEKGSCIAMKPRDAQLLERKRGYSDIDPTRAWEQWLVVSANHRA